MFLACKVTTKKPFVQAKRVKSGWKWLFCPLTMRFGGHFVTDCCISARDKAIKPFILYYKKRTCHLQGPKKVLVRPFSSVLLCFFPTCPSVGKCSSHRVSGALEG